MDQPRINFVVRAADAYRDMLAALEVVYLDMRSDFDVLTEEEWEEWGKRSASQRLELVRAAIAAAKGDAAAEFRRGMLPR